MSCPTSSIVKACDFPQFLVDQTPKFDEIIMEDIRPSDGWLLNVSTGTLPMGTPTEVTQDRFRHVFPNTTKKWNRVVANGTGCSGNPCDPTLNQLGWGADRLTWYAEEQTWGTPMFCFNQDMHITHAKEHIAQIIDKILRPATIAISSNFLRKRHLLWSKRKWQANRYMTAFTYVWTLGGAAGDEEIYFDCSCDPNNVFHLAPQMLQNRYQTLMMDGYSGENPFKENAPFVELVSDMDTVWWLEHLGGSQGIGGIPSVSGNWRFEQWDAASAYWRYGFGGKIGNYQVRVDPMGLRFNYVTDRGAGAAPNRYRYQVILPYRNGITTGAGGAAGLGSDTNPDFLTAQFRISQIHHKRGMQLLTPDARSLHPDMPWAHPDFGGKWRFLQHDLGADQDGTPISNMWGNKGLFGAWFQYYVRPLHYEFMESIFHRSEQFCIPEITTCSPDPGYPAQEYSSELPGCPLPETFIPATTIPEGGVIPTDTFNG